MNINYIIKLAFLEIKNLHAQSFLGAWWFFLNPIILFSTYYFFSIYVMKSNIQGLDSIETALFIIMNLSVFFIFSNTLLTACNSFSGSIDLFRHTSYNHMSFLIKYVIINMSIYIPIILMCFAFRLYEIGAAKHIFIFPYVFFICFLLTAFVSSLVFILSCIVVVVKDFSNVLNVIVLSLMFISPLGIRSNKIYDINIFIYYCNPLTYFLTPLQSAFVNGQIMDARYLCILTLSVLSLLGISLKLFNFLKRALTDHV